VITGQTVIDPQTGALQLQAIGFIEACYKEKFGIPRQPGLVTAARSRLRCLTEFSNVEAFKGLEQFSHIWLIFGFHANANTAWSNTVRPPRLGGNKRLGVFATRSMFRPNPVGLSVAQLLGIEFSEGRACLNLAGTDLLDGTPVYDIKPYLPYADSLPEAQGGFANAAPELMWNVVFSEQATEQCREQSARFNVDIDLLIQQILQQDPRPAYRHQQLDNRIYAMKLYDFDVRWHYRASFIEVISLTSLLEPQTNY
jgi:tRNA-Thr(GGU) m(6)t(6)A37 methyltransferase TsaA